MFRGQGDEEETEGGREPPEREEKKPKREGKGRKEEGAVHCARSCWEVRQEKKRIDPLDLAGDDW